MTIAEALISEFVHESQGTRKMLERLPGDELTWKPHQKSMSLGELSTHIAHIPEWANTIVNHDQLDLSTVDFKVDVQSNRQAILDYFDGRVDGFKKVLEGKPDDHLLKNWKLINEGQVVVDMPRAACLRTFILSHVIHHRGQLSVYLRENDVPLPGLYGPSADEPM